MLNLAVNAQILEQLVTQHEIVFVDFWAEWCAPCKQFERIYEKVSEEYPQIAFAKVNLETEASLSETFEIRSIPHLIVFKKGVIIYSESGSIPESAFRELVEQAIQVDVEAILTEMEEKKE